jgi:hypothetical protein
MTAPTPPTTERRRERLRRTRLRARKQKLAQRVITFARDDRQARDSTRSRRLQLQAKLRMWQERVEDLPWPDASNVALPDIATASLIAQDSLHNAVMSARPAVVSRATNPDGKDTQELIDDLLDSQFFVEHQGEKTVEDMIQNFVEEGHVQVLVAWVRETRKITDIRRLGRIPFDREPEDWFIEKIGEHFHQAMPVRQDEEGWDWLLRKVPPESDIEISFYTRPETGNVEMLIRKEVPIYDGPLPIVYEYDRCLYPPRCKNLQPPGPSNPGGAPHVIFVDYPTVDEIAKLQKKGFYDLISKKDMSQIRKAAKDTTEDDEERQKDAFQGVDDEVPNKVESQRRLTRFLCFDRYDLDGDGLDEDVVFWVLKEGGWLLKAKPMTEPYPTEDGRRPIAEAAFLPEAGRREGISLPEFQESLHDIAKATFDQMVDAGTLANTPFGFYDPTGNMKPDVITVYPGDLYPMRNPKNNVHYPQFAARSQTFGINLMSLVDSMDQKLTVFSNPLKAGQVPKGKASALRNVGSIDRIQESGEARPERILRRFFTALKQIFSLMHEFNGFMLPPEKKFRLVGYTRPQEDPYRTITAEQVRKKFVFDFTANVQNASRGAAFDQLQLVLGLTIQPLPVEMGITTPDDVYRLLYDSLRRAGLQEPERYISEPTPATNAPRILAEEAIAALLMENAPFGEPLEGAQKHLEVLLEFKREPEQFAAMSPKATAMFQVYAEEVAQKAAEERKIALRAELAAQFGGGPAGRNGSQGPLAPPPPDEGNPPVQGDELLDESLQEGGG